MGGAYISLGQHQMAFASLQQAISLNHNDFHAYLKLGMLYEQLALTAGYLHLFIWTYISLSLLNAIS